MADESDPNVRLLTFDAYTDDSAPDYDGLTVVYTSVLSALLVAATVGLVWVLEDSMIAELAATEFGYNGPFERPVVGVAVAVVLFAVLAVGRYASVRAIDSDSVPTAVGVTVAQVLVNAVVLTVAAEVILVVLTDRLLLSLGVGALLLSLIGNLVVLATDWDLSDTDILGVLVLVGIVVVAAISGIAWNNSTDGLYWWLYLQLWNLIIYIMCPVFFLTLYVHDVWRISEEGLSPTVGAMSTYTAVAGLLLIPVEYVLGVIKLFMEADSSSN